LTKIIKETTHSGCIEPGNAKGEENQYMKINADAYQLDQEDKLMNIQKAHLDHHNKALGFNHFNPTEIRTGRNHHLKANTVIQETTTARTRVKAKLDELGGNLGYEGTSDAPPKGRTNDQLEEGPLKDKAKKVAMAGMTAANMYTMVDAMSQHKPRPQTDMVRAATALPGAAGWAASAAHYGKKGYDLAKDALKKKKATMEEENKMPNPCWKGYKAYGMKKKNGKEVPNCAPVEEDIDESAAWQRSAGKDPEGGLNRKGIASYRREHPGSKLSMAVTTKPSKLDPDSKPAKRRKSFCARMGGMKGPMKDEKGRPTRKALALRKWNCEEETKYPETAERGIYEKAPPGDKFERMVKHIKAGYAKDGKLTKKEKGIAFATAWKAKNKEKLNEGAPAQANVDFFNRLTKAGVNKGMPESHAKQMASLAAFESGWGKSHIAQKGKNYFGQTGEGPGGHIIGADKQKHKVFNSDDEAVEHHVNKWSKYYSNDPKETTANLVKAGYNKVNPKWSSNIMSIHNKYSSVASSTKPEAPKQPEVSKAPEAPKPTQVASTPSAPETPKLQNPDQNITKVASTPAPLQVSQTDTKDKKPTQVASLQELKAETLGSYIKKASASRKKALHSSKADIKTWGKRQKGITTAVKQLTKENSKDKDFDDAVGFMGKSDVAEQQSHIHLNKPDLKKEVGATGTTHTIHEETTMENQDLINEAIENILENDLNAMKENLMTALQEKAQEKLEEKKKIIASEYFAQ